MGLLVFEVLNVQSFESQYDWLLHDQSKQLALGHGWS
jgi:hypothetical protein